MNELKKQNTFSQWMRALKTTLYSLLGGVGLPLHVLCDLCMLPLDFFILLYYTIYGTFSFLENLTYYIQNKNFRLALQVITFIPIVASSIVFGCLYSVVKMSIDLLSYGSYLLIAPFYGFLQGMYHGLYGGSLKTVYQQIVLRCALKEFSKPPLEFPFGKRFFYPWPVRTSRWFIEELTQQKNTDKKTKKDKNDLLNTPERQLQSRRRIIADTPSPSTKHNIENEKDQKTTSIPKLKLIEDPDTIPAPPPMSFTQQQKKKTDSTTMNVESHSSTTGSTMPVMNSELKQAILHGKDRLKQIKGASEIEELHHQEKNKNVIESQNRKEIKKEKQEKNEERTDSIINQMIEKARLLSNNRSQTPTQPRTKRSNSVVCRSRKVQQELEKTIQDDCSPKALKFQRPVQKNIAELRKILFLEQKSPGIIKKPVPPPFKKPRKTVPSRSKKLQPTPPRFKKPQQAWQKKSETPQPS